MHRKEEYFKNFSIDIRKSSKDSKHHPLDKSDISSYMGILMNFSGEETAFFFAHNAVRYEYIYSSRLMFCLPELWYKLHREDIVDMFGMCSTIRGGASIFRFLHRYLNINPIPFVCDSKLSIENKRKIIYAFYDAFSWLTLDFVDEISYKDSILGVSKEEHESLSRHLKTNLGFTSAFESETSFQRHIDTLNYPFGASM